MTSIRATLTRTLLVGLALVLAVVGAGLDLLVSAALTKRFDEALAARAAGVRAAVRWDEGRVEIDLDPSALREFYPGEAPAYFTVRPATTEADSLMGEGPFDSPSLAGRALDTGIEGFSNLALPDARPGRALRETFRPSRDDPSDPEGTDAPALVLIVAVDRAALDAGTRTATWAIALGALVVLVGTALLVVLGLRRGLLPLEALSHRLSAIDERTLDRAVPDHDAPAELQPVYARVNDLRARLHEAFERQRRFTDAAAHELRTPIAELRTAIEASRARPRSTDESAATLDALHGVTLRLGRQVEALLTLSRLRAGTENAPRADAIDLTATVRRAVERHGAQAQQQGGSITFDPAAQATVAGDAALVESVIENLMTNAVEHAEPTPRVRITLESGLGVAVLTVRNPAAGPALERPEAMFEPFWRASASRSDQRHLGLGLAIAREAARAIGGDIRAQREGDDHLAVHLTLRSAEAGAGAEAEAAPAAAAPAP
ncbi:MAG: sensor histidine kinase [Phycisphaerales bacterium]